MADHIEPGEFAGNPNDPFGYRLNEDGTIDLMYPGSPDPVATFNKNDPPYQAIYGNLEKRFRRTDLAQEARGKRLSDADPNSPESLSREAKLNEFFHEVERDQMDEAVAKKIRFKPGDPKPDPEPDAKVEIMAVAEGDPDTGDPGIFDQMKALRDKAINAAMRGKRPRDTGAPEDTGDKD